MHHLKHILGTAFTAVILIAVLAINASALSYGTGVTTDNLRLRKGPGTDTTILTTVAKGTKVELLEAAVDGWYKVSFQGTVGYMSADYLTVTVNTDTAAEAGTENTDTAPDAGTETADTAPDTGIVNTDGSTLNLRSGPGTGYTRLASIPCGATLTLTGIENGWYQTSYNGVAGYVSSDYIRLIDASAAPADGSLAAQLIAYAKQFLGTRYVYGASGPNSFDCSGFTSYVFKHFGYSLNRSAAGQYSNGVVIDRSELQPGDLILWRSYTSSSAATHVGIYIGNHQYIHASSSRGYVCIDDLDWGLNARYMVGCRRILT